MTTVLDEDTRAPVAGVYVVGLFGALSSFHGTRFDCQGADVAESDSMGRFQFNRALTPWFIYGYKPGYWMVFHGGITPGNFTMTTRDPGPAAYAGRPDMAAPANTALRRKLDLSRQILQRCWDVDRFTMMALRPLHIAMLGEALTSNDTELIVDFCRRVATEGDAGGRERGGAGHFVYTELERKRLLGVEPRCLSRERLVAEMRRMQTLNGRGVGPSRESDNDVLGRAIVVDVVDYRKKIEGFHAPGAECFSRAAPATNFNCHTRYGLSAFANRAVIFERRLNEEGIAFEVDRSENVIRYRSEDLERFVKIYREESADL